MTPEEQFALEMEKRRAATEAVMRSLQNDTHGPSMNPVVADAVANPPAVEPEPAPVAAEAPAVEEKPAVAPAAPAVQPATASPVSFYDMILQNDAIRNKEKEDWERREKSDRARTTIAAVTDALASLGNLVGTTHGAFSQPQTYQTPFITEQVERDRALARSRADMLYNSDNNLRMAQAKYDQQLANIDRQLAVQDKMTERELAKIEARAALAADTAKYKSDQIAQQGDIRKDVARMNNESAERRTAKTAGVSRANALTRDAFNRDKLEAQKNGEIGSGSGGVGGYTTETNIEYNDMGQKVRETKSRTGANGNTTTTTTTTTPSKTPPSKQKKQNSKTPPSKRK